MRICIDLDGVICELRGAGMSYADVQPLPGAVEKLHALRAAGHTIVLHTARHMRTCGGNVALAVARIGRLTFEWLERYQVPYDEIHFGKPWADVYIDDNALRFQSWHLIRDDGSDLPVSAEASNQK